MALRSWAGFRGSPVSSRRRVRAGSSGSIGAAVVPPRQAGPARPEESGPGTAGRAGTPRDGLVAGRSGPAPRTRANRPPGALAARPARPGPREHPPQDNRLPTHWQQTIGRRPVGRRTRWREPVARPRRAGAARVDARPDTAASLDLLLAFLSFSEVRLSRRSCERSPCPGRSCRLRRCNRPPTADDALLDPRSIRPALRLMPVPKRCRTPRPLNGGEHVLTTLIPGRRPTASVRSSGSRSCARSRPHRR